LIAEICFLPLEFYSEFVVEHRYGLSRQRPARWLVQKLKEWALSLLLALPLALGFYALVWTWPNAWWLPAAAGWFLVSVVLGHLGPVLILPVFYRSHPVDDPDLVSRLRTLARGTGLEIRGVYRIDMGQDTSKPNAALAGLGSTRRVLVTDTLLEELTTDEIAAVFAHEVGHHVYHHIPKLLILGGALSALGLWLCSLVVADLAGRLHFAGAGDVGALPVLCLVLTAFGLVMLPTQNAISRAFERQCDRYALRQAATPEAFAGALSTLARVSLADPNPHPLVVWFFYSHPPIAQRVADAQRWTDDG